MSSLGGTCPYLWKVSLFYILKKEVPTSILYNVLLTIHIQANFRAAVKKNTTHNIGKPTSVPQNMTASVLLGTAF